jgi:hypothetical protein
MTGEVRLEDITLREFPPSPKQWRGSVPYSRAWRAFPPSRDVRAYARERHDEAHLSPDYGGFR